jgi:hypothetical protein
MHIIFTVIYFVLIEICKINTCKNASAQYIQRMNIYRLYAHVR